MLRNFSVTEMAASLKKSNKTCFRDSHEYRPCLVGDNDVVSGDTAKFLVALLKKRYVGNVASYFLREMSSPQSWCSEFKSSGILRLVAGLLVTDVSDWTLKDEVSAFFRNVANE